MATSWPVAREESLEGLPQPPARRGCFISGIMVAFECESRMPKDARFGVPVKSILRSLHCTSSKLLPPLRGSRSNYNQACRTRSIVARRTYPGWVRM